jgi:hypothetical protein
MTPDTHRFTAALLVMSVVLAAGPARAQPTGPTSTTEIPMDDYLGLLARITPAAHDGARAFLDAHRRRCGHDLSSAQLRIAMAAADGDPVLMSMIRASHLRDAAALAALAGQVTCRKLVP